MRMHIFLLHGTGAIWDVDVQLENWIDGCSSPALRGCPPSFLHLQHTKTLFWLCFHRPISDLRCCHTRCRAQVETCRDTIAKLLYSKMFEWLVARINSGLFTKTASCTINILDIFGFEDFTHNTFEQVRPYYFYLSSDQFSSFANRSCA